MKDVDASAAGSPARVSVVLPTYNERDNIGPLIEAITKAMEQSGQPASEIIVVDDDSPDGTWQVVREIAERAPHVRLIHRTSERGLTSAIATGIAQAKGEIVAWMDCDFSMPPELIPELVAALEGADLAVGSRYVHGGMDVGHSLAGQLFSRAINLFASLLLDFSIKDYTSGFVAARREVFDRIGLRGDYGEYCIDLLYRAKRLGFRIKEIPYRCVPRRAGESKTAPNIMGYFRRGWKYVLTILRLRFGWKG
ncbi:MAG: polyprenol monophosphomannose synthase [Anaerolineae bacterium]